MKPQLINDIPLENVLMGEYEHLKRLSFTYMGQGNHSPKLNNDLSQVIIITQIINQSNDLILTQH